MTLSRLTVCVGVGLSAVAVIAATRPSGSPATRPGTFAAAQVHRIQIHLDSALTMLAADDVGRLSDGQESRRRAAIETLRAYRDRGVFPHNYDFTEQTPYFVDRKTGTLCAVAALLSSTGRNDIVARVARANNNVRVRQLAGDTAFTSWLDANGLTLDEAAFIQVVYAAAPSNAGVTAFLVGTVSLVPSVTTSLWNLSGNQDGHRTTMSRIGIVSGLVSVVAGAQMRVSDDDLGLRPFANATMAVGASAVALSMRSMMHHSKMLHDEREASRRRIADASISPLLAPDLSRTGMAVSIRF